MNRDKSTTTISMIASAFAASVFLVAASSTYADSTCEVTCKDGTQDTGSAADGDACRDQCGTYCGTNDAVLSCMFSGQNVKGNCDVECKDETFDHIMLNSSS